MAKMNLTVPGKSSQGSLDILKPEIWNEINDHLFIKQKEHVEEKTACLVEITMQ